MKLSFFHHMIRLINLVLLITLGSGAYAVERSEELAGAQESVDQQSLESLQIEPERLKAGENEERPTLKLPEVIVKGDKKYQVSAEKKELMEIDPMKDTNDIPEDLTKLSMPGFNEMKDAPSQMTMTSKDYLVQIETGGGMARHVWGDLIIGYETKQVDVLSKIRYTQQASQAINDFVPFDQQAELELTIGVPITQVWKLDLDIEGETSGHENPLVPASLGKWIHHQNFSMNVVNKLKLSEQTILGIDGGYGEYCLYSGEWLNASEEAIRASDYLHGSISLDTNLSIFHESDLNVLVDAMVKAQKLKEQVPSNAYSELEETFGEIKLRTRFQPLNEVALDIGVKMNYLNQLEITHYNLGSILGNIDVTLPWNAIVYLRLDGGMEWTQAHELIPDHHRIIRQYLTDHNRLLEPETYKKLAVGWRQKIDQQLAVDLSWTRQLINDYLIWTNDQVVSLFNYQTIDDVSLEMINLKIQYQPLRHLSIEAGVGYNRAVWQDNKQVPYQPLVNGDVTITGSLQPWTFILNYHYLGERRATISEPAIMLDDAHLLDLTADYHLNSNWDLMVELANLLNEQWVEWAGYPENGLTVLAGVRVTF